MLALRGSHAERPTPIVCVMAMFLARRNEPSLSTIPLSQNWSKMWFSAAIKFLSRLIHPPASFVTDEAPLSLNSG